MSAPNPGRQSPPPEESSGKQQAAPPSDAHGVNQSSKNQDDSKKDLEALTSNPAGPLDAHLKEIFSKTETPKK